MEILIIALLLGLIPGMIAQSKGRSFGLWWFYGFMLFIIALPHSLLMSADKKAVEGMKISEGMKKCPQCAELVEGDANVCRYCNYNFTSDSIVNNHDNLEATHSDTNKIEIQKNDNITYDNIKESAKIFYGSKGFNDIQYNNEDSLMVINKATNSSYKIEDKQDKVLITTYNTSYKPDLLIDLIKKPESKTKPESELIFQTDNTQKLIDLGAMFEKGLLTKEEFEVQKKQLLSS